MARKINKICILFSVIVLIGVNVSCQTEHLSQVELQLTQYALKITDLPNGWKSTGKSWNANYGGESYSVNYQLDPNNWLGHTVAIYADENAAKLAFPQWEDMWFDSNQPWSEATYSPSDPRDDFRFECLQMSGDPVIACDYLQRHNRVIGLVRINLDKQGLTFTELNRLLGILDKRLNEIGAEHNQETPTP